jgi:predicted phosphodiesterase
MRYAILADIHGNLHALQAVLNAVRTEHIDAYLVAGDLVGYGPFPNECVEAVAALNPVCVAGNHDLIALGSMSEERCIQIAQQSLRWTRETLRDDTRQYLASLPRRAEAAGGVIVAHGSLDDPEEYTTRPEQVAWQLKRIVDDGASVIILGHTHRPAAYDVHGRQRRGSTLRFAPGQPTLFNPGAVGQSREFSVWARFGILDTDRGEWRFGVAHYDVAACRDALRREGLSLRGCHLPPSIFRATGRLARRVVQSANWRTQSR